MSALVWVLIDGCARPFTNGRHLKTQLLSSCMRAVGWGALCVRMCAFAHMHVLHMRMLIFHITSNLTIFSSITHMQTWLLRCCV